jgi:hypothetical protein
MMIITSTLAWLLFVPSIHFLLHTFIYGQVMGPCRFPC